MRGNRGRARLAGVGRREGPEQRVVLGDELQGGRIGADPQDALGPVDLRPQARRSEVFPVCGSCLSCLRCFYLRLLVDASLRFAKRKQATILGLLTLNASNAAAKRYDMSHRVLPPPPLISIITTLTNH